MKVSTDSLLLGAWVELSTVARVADFGCGCGILALMMAQRTSDNVVLYAIERDQQAAQQAADNVAASPWPQKVRVVHQDIRHCRAELFDLVISNPPYFSGSLASGDKSRALARQGDDLDLNDWFACAAAATSANGQIAMVVPASQWQRLHEYSQQQGWSVARCCQVTTVAHKAPKLMLAQWQRNTIATTYEQLLIQNNGRYTDQFRQLTGAFYLAATTSVDPVPVYPD